MSLYYNYYKSIHLPFSRFILGVVALSLIQAAAPACAQSGSQSYTLKQAIDYALQKNAAVNNAQLDIASAKARVGETRAIGLPQISVTGNFTHNIKIQQFVLENVPGSTFGYDQNKPAFAPMPLALSLNNSAFLAAQLNQILFSGSYIVALRASGTFQELSQKSLKASRIQVAGSVSKAYYSVLVAEEQLTLLDKNINRLDSTFRETQQMNVSGFVEKIDVDRVEVALNNLKAERQNTQRMVEVSRALLKYQMGMEQQDPIQLTDRLQSIKPEAKPLPTQNFEHSRRIEYSLLQTQRRLNELDMQNIKSGYLPSLSFSVSYGTNSGAGTIGRLTEFGDRWYPYSVAMLNLNIPIFDGLSKSYQGQQKKLSIMKT
ncbi:MAG: TolC family protein, partial [Bacteroidota bacterium]